MDVSCENCKAEYEFDDSLLGDEGTTVKCSACGHVFRLTPASQHRGRASLKLRTQRDGRVVALASLRDLQQLIHAGEAGLHDELGRDGLPWRKLGDLPELRTFFITSSPSSDERVGQRDSPPRPTPERLPPGAETILGGSRFSLSQTPMPAPPRDPRPSANRTILGVGPADAPLPPPPRLPSMRGSSASPANDRANDALPRRAQAGGAGTSTGESASDAPTDPPPGAAGPSRRTNPAVSNPVARLYLAEDEAPPARATADSSRVWIFASVAGAIALGGALVAASLPGPAAKPVPRVEATAPVDDSTPELNGPGSAPLAAPTEPQPNAAAVAAPVAPSPTAPVAPSPAEPAAPEPAAAPRGPDSTTAGETAGPARTEAEHGKGKPGHDGPAREATPEDYSGYVARGDSALRKGDGAAAKDAYTAALALRASGSEATTGLGYALLAQDKARESIPHFERAARNGYAEAHIGLGDAHRKLGAREPARQAYQTYLDRLPSGARAAYARKQLDALRGGSAAPAGPAPTGAAAPHDDRGDYRPAGEVGGPAPAEPPPEPPVAPEGEATP